GAPGRRAEAAPPEPGPRPERDERDHGHDEPAPTRTRRPAVAVDSELSQEFGGVHRVLSIHWHLVQCATAGDAYRLTRAPFGSTPWHDGRQRDIVQVCLVSRRASDPGSDRKSTRLNSSHQIISYAVFCLKKKNTK